MVLSFKNLMRGVGQGFNNDKMIIAGDMCLNDESVDEIKLIVKYIEK